MKRRRQIKRPWGATGVAYYRSRKITPERRQEIEDILKAKGIEIRDLDDFFKDLAEAIGKYQSHLQLKEASRPAAVRKNLRAALDTAMKLNARLNALDGNSRALVREAAGGNNLSSLFNHLDAIIQPLCGAWQLAQQYPSEGGSLPKHERHALARDVANAMKAHLGVKPTTTRGGPFEDVLSAVLEEAPGRRFKEIHRLVEAALKADP